MAIVPHELPVLKAINAAIMKTRVGRYLEEGRGGEAKRG
jgi:hypothetical protein